MYKIIFYVPATHLEAVKEAMFAAGGGHIGNYDQCAWQVLGTGQYRPLAAANPFQGTCGTKEVTPEYQVEMVCAPELIRAVVHALKTHHPYETPAYQVLELLEF